MEEKQWKPNMAQINALTAAIKQVDKGNSDVLKGLKEKLMELFLELKEDEDEDEKIRKEIKKDAEAWYKEHYEGSNPQGRSIVIGAYIDGALAWLEKQSEQKYIPKYKIGDYVKNTNYKGEPIYEIIYMDKECYICEYRGKENMGDKAVMHFAFDNPYLRLVQKPATWSEEDENNILFLTSIIEECFKDKEKITLYSDTVCANFTKEDVIDRLKSLKDRVQSQPKQVWKPSDVQILALDEVYKTHGANNVCRRIIFNLMNDLKKLREE